jgi:hypothetical protein
VDSISTATDKTVDLLDSNLTAVFGFLSTPGDIATVMNCKYDRTRETTVAFIERKV